MQPLSLATDAASIAILVALAFVSRKVVSAFKQSKQALIESASIISVIVDALTSRMEQSELVVGQVQGELEGLKTRSAGMEWEQATLRSSHEQLMGTLNELLAKDKRLIEELEHLRTRIAPQSKPRPHEPIPSRSEQIGVLDQANILSALTPTEHETLEILRREGPKAAPELGGRLGKSREHTARLMKKLYLEGYVDRESNRAPFRYRLTDPVRSAFDGSVGSITAEAQEKA